MPSLNVKNSIVGDGINGLPVKYVMFPISRNKIHLRLENIFDHFDAKDPT